MDKWIWHVNHTVCHRRVTALDQLSKVAEPEASRHLLRFVTLAKPPVSVSISSNLK